MARTSSTNVPRAERACELRLPRCATRPGRHVCSAAPPVAVRKRANRPRCAADRRLASSSPTPRRPKKVTRRSDTRISLIRNFKRPARWVPRAAPRPPSSRSKLPLRPLQTPVRNPGRHAPRVNHRLHIDHHPALLHHREQGPLQKLQILPMRHRQHHGGQVLLRRCASSPRTPRTPGSSSGE